MRKKKRPEFDRLVAAKQLSEAESCGFHEGMNTTVWPDSRNNPYQSGRIIGGDAWDAWDSAVRAARERGWLRGQDLRRAEIKRICEAESEEP